MKIKLKRFITIIKFKKMKSLDLPHWKSYKLLLTDYGKAKREGYIFGSHVPPESEFTRVKQRSGDSLKILFYRSLNQSGSK